jgi:hypothetical protein
MPSTGSLQRLREAIELEQQDRKQLRRSFLELTHRMALYQSGEGPAPTVAEFLAWREIAAQQAGLLMQVISDSSATMTEEAHQPHAQDSPSEH